MKNFLLILMTLMGLSSCEEMTSADFKPMVGPASTLTPPPAPLICPAGYIKIPADSALSTSEFCVMKYEAKAWEDTNADGVVDAAEIDLDGCDTVACGTADWGTIWNGATGVRPVPHQLGQPWRKITNGKAKTACQALGSGYSLISNPQWMAMAHALETNPNNWSGGVLNRGSSDNNPVSVCDAALDNVDANCSTPGAGHEQKRTFELASGDLIWDVAGNANEWVDFYVLPANKAWASTLEAVPGSTARELQLVDAGFGSGAGFMTLADIEPVDTTKTTAQNIGAYFAGTTASGGYATRGGGTATTVNAGIYTLSLVNSSTSNLGSISFRCVYRP